MEYVDQVEDVSRVGQESRGLEDVCWGECYVCTGFVRCVLRVLGVCLVYSSCSRCLLGVLGVS